MSQGGVLAAKAIAGAGLTGLAVLVWRTRWADGLTPARTASWLVGGLLATRLGLFVGLFWLAGVPASSDVAGYYHPQATAVLAGQVPGRLAVAAFLLLESVLLAGYLWLLVRTWRALRCGGEVASPAARAVAW